MGVARQLWLSGSPTEPLANCLTHKVKLARRCSESLKATTVVEHSMEEFSTMMSGSRIKELFEASSTFQHTSNMYGEEAKKIMDEVGNTIEQVRPIPTYAMLVGAVDGDVKQKDVRA